MPLIESNCEEDVRGLRSSVGQEAGLPLRTMLVEFDSYEIALAAHESAVYLKALQALGSGAERDYRIVEGA